MISDYSKRGDRKFGDKCETDMECGFPHSTCDSKKKSCQCVEDKPVTNHIDKCGKGKMSKKFKCPFHKTQSCVQITSPPILH